MSSHHVVREKQEPALLVLDIDGFEDELLGQLLEWSPTVMVTEEAAEQLHSRRIKIDWIIGKEAYGSNQPNVNRLVCGSIDRVETAMKWLISNQYPAVNIITGSFNQDSFNCYQSRINLVIFCNSCKIYPVTSGFSKWKPAGEIIKIVSSVQSLEVSGLQHEANNSYKTTANGLIQLFFKEKFIFISEEI